MESKQPLYALLIAPDSKMRQAILDGTKKISIREGHRAYPIGAKIMLCCHLEPWAVMANIIKVCHTTLWKVTEEDYMADGFESLDKFFCGMQKFYPNISMGSAVTIIKWDNVSGILVDEIKRINELKKHYPQTCQCENFEHGLVANDCHVHNENPRHFIDGENLDCDCYTVK